MIIIFEPIPVKPLHFFNHLFQRNWIFILLNMFFDDLILGLNTEYNFLKKEKNLQIFKNFIHAIWFEQILCISSTADRNVSLFNDGTVKLIKTTQLDGA